MPSLLQIAQELTLCLASDVTPLLLGERGIGKSSIVRELAFDEAPEFAKLREELWGSGEPVGFINLRGSLHEAADFTGLPLIPTLNGNGKGDGEKAEAPVTDFAPPTILPQVKRHGERGLLLLDEIFRAQADVQQAIFQLVEHQVGPDGGIYHQCSRYVLPAGWDVVAASNPPRGRNYSQNALLDAAFMDRFVQLYVEVDEQYLMGWVMYMNGLGGGEARREVEKVLAYTAGRDTGSMFLGVQPQLEGEGRPQSLDDDQGGVYPSPRTWEAVVRVNTVARRLGIYGETAHRRVLAGMVGLGLVHDFLNTEPGVGARTVLERDREEWEGDVLRLGHDETRNLVWTLMGMLPELTDVPRRGRLLDCLEVLTSNGASPDNWDLVVALAQRVAMEGARELGISLTYGNATVTGPRALESILRTVEGAGEEKLDEKFWLVMLMARPELSLYIGRLVMGEKPSEVGHDEG